MKQFATLFLSLLFTVCGYTQTTTKITFEDISIGTDTFLNGSDGVDGHTSFGTFFPVDYDTSFGYWASGVAISTTVDTADGTFANLYGAYSSSLSLDTYGVANLGGDSFAISTVLPTSGSASYVSIDVTNTTYAYKSMLNGDGFAKMFGGESGDDPDYFFIRFYSGSDSLDVYLADFRFEDNSQDYILDDWTTIDLSELDFSSSDLYFKAFSSDTGEFGINTPLFFAFDNLVYSFSTGVEDLPSQNERLWSDGEYLHYQGDERARISIFDINGTLQYQSTMNSEQTIPFQPLNEIIIVRSETVGGVNAYKLFH